MNKHGIRLITAVVTSSMIVTPVLAAPSVDDLKKEKASKQDEVSSLQSQLTTLMGKVNTLESELIQTGEDITKAQSDLVVAQKKEKEQYAAMKKRIKYMYEAGNDSAFETLVTSDDFTDLLSKAEYVQNVHSYDRKQGKVYNIIIRPLVICVDRSFRTHKADVGSSGEDGRHSFVGSETSHERKVDSFVGKISLFDCHIHRSIEDGVCYFI